MKKGRYSEDQMVRILREADQMPVTQVAKKHGVSEASIYAWRKKYGELEVTDVRRIRTAILLRREGFPMSFDRAWRLWRTASLQVPKKRRRRRPASARPRPTAPQQCNHVWAYDFIFDRCANGQVLKCLTVVDEYTRECLAIDVAGRIRSARVIDQLAKLISVHGAPTYLRSDVLFASVPKEYSTVISPLACANGATQASQYTTVSDSEPRMPPAGNDWPAI